LRTGGKVRAGSCYSCDARRTVPAVDDMFVSIIDGSCAWTRRSSACSAPWWWSMSPLFWRGFVAIGFVTDFLDAL